MIEEKTKKHTLLIIDDEIAITNSLFRQFRRKYNVFAVNNANDAFPILDKIDVQVIVSDQRMPGLTGVDFFKRIKDKYPDTLKLILSGYSDLDAVIGAINEGQVFRFLTKPWNPMELELALDEAFEKYDLISSNRKLMQELATINSQLEEKVKERTSELERANEKLTSLNIEKNKYVGIVAHDLRNPIGSAQSFAGLLVDDYDDFSKDEKLRFLAIINERCTYALNLIASFLDVSKIEAGIFELNMEKHDYIQFVNEIVNQHTLFAKNKSQEIIFNGQIAKLEFLFDKDKLEQVLSNLLSNAIKYSFPGKNMEVKVALEKKKVVTQVIDSGQGIPNDEISNLFNPYLGTSVKATAGEKSTGLGLVIVKRIVEAHDGTIEVISTPGKGSVFTISLPYNGA
ncbi:hybrid sensor histidine kinase/response regulator [uncultured Draconibacterium sp.]|uniref:hybrid sensor histidine kinase/response regulator n=1 Tax=uncultured Draconibacterium sp. TaxID=1573823 RepID=UPI0032605EBB